MTRLRDISWREEWTTDKAERRATHRSGVVANVSTISAAPLKERVDLELGQVGSVEGLDLQILSEQAVRLWSEQQF